MMAHLISGLVSCSSSRITGISGATPNQAKKQRKKASHVMWNARICGRPSRKKFRQSEVHLSGGGTRFSIGLREKSIVQQRGRPASSVHIGCAHHPRND